jgi:hypothetical protein
METICRLGSWAWSANYVNIPILDAPCLHNVYCTKHLIDNSILYTKWGRNSPHNFKIETAGSINTLRDGHHTDLRWPDHIDSHLSSEHNLTIKQKYLQDKNSTSERKYFKVHSELFLSSSVAFMTSRRSAQLVIIGKPQSSSSQLKPYYPWI